MENSLSELAALWDKALKKIETQLNEKILYDSLFTNSYIDRIHGNVITVVANSDFGATLLKTKYYDLIADIIKDLTDTDYNLVFVTEKDLEKSKNSNPVEKTVHYFQDSFLNNSLNFNNFVVGEFNREASQASLFVSSKPGKMFNPLFIYSSSGLGKTHLLHSIGNYISKESKPGAKVLYMTADNFVEEYIKFARGEKESQSLKDYVSSFDVLLFDDVQFLAGKVKSEEMFFSIFENMQNHDKQIVITSDRQPIELSGLEERLVTRFSRGLVVKIDKPDQNTCIEILKKKIEASNLDINRFDENVLVFFANKFSNNVRELEGALNRLMFYSVSLNNVDRITMDVASKAVEGLFSGKSLSSQINENKIINTVSEYYSISPSQITGLNRSAQIVLARHIAMYLIKVKLDLPYKQIGIAFGGKDHTTIMHAIEKVENSLKTDRDMEKAINELNKRLSK